MNLTKKHGSWYVIVNTGWDPNKKRYGQKRVCLPGLTDKDGKKKAEQVAIDTLAKMHNDGFDLTGKNKGMTLKELLEEYINGYKKCHKPQGVVSASQKIYDHLIPNLGDIPLVKLTRTDLTKYYVWASEHGRKDGKGGLAGETIKQAHRILHAALNYASEVGYVASNVADRIDFARLNITDSAFRGRALTENEIKYVLQHLAEEKNSDFYLPALLGMWTGLRLGEIMGLRWSDIHPCIGQDGNVYKQLVIMQTLQHTKERGHFFLTEEEIRRTRCDRRRVILPLPALEALEEAKKKQASNRAFFGDAYQSNLDLVCCRADGSVLSVRVVSRQWSDFARKIRIPIRFHDLRHSNATLLMMSQVPLPAVQRHMGHASEAFTADRYDHMDIAGEMLVVQALNQVAGRLPQSSVK